MPIYEYRCERCGRRFSFLVLRSDDVPHCDRCGSSQLRKLISRVRFLRSEEDRLERLADPATFAGLDENDPRSVARLMKRFGRELGDELGEDVDQLVEEAMEEADSQEAEDEEDL